MEIHDLYQTLLFELTDRHLVHLRENDPEIREMTLQQIERIAQLQTGMSQEQYQVLSEYLDTENRLQAQRMQGLFLAGARESVHLMRTLNIIT